MLAALSRSGRVATTRRRISSGQDLTKLGLALSPARTWAEGEDANFSRTPLTELFGGRKVVLLAVPGAFTGVCQSQHVPSFAKLSAEFKGKGVDEIACVSINDPYTMKAWAEAMDCSSEAISFYADSDEAFTRAIGETRDCNGDALGPGMRSNRYSVLVEDGVVTRCFVEEGPGDFAVSDGATLLAAM